MTMTQLPISPIELQSVIVQYLTGTNSLYTLWFPVVVIASVMIISILGFIYALTGIWGRSNIGLWVKAKIYEVLFSLVLVFIFFFMVQAFLAINPVPAFQSAGLAQPSFDPSVCPQVKSPYPNAQDPVQLLGNGQTVPTDMYALSICDMKQFLSSTADLNEFVFWLSVRLSLVPQITVNLESLFTSVAEYGLGLKMQFFLIPFGIDQLLSWFLGIFNTLFMANNVQLLLLASAAMFFSVLMAIGLIARVFVITRTFGGSMIALAIGIGILYPFLVCVTYGFINTGIQANNVLLNPWADLFTVILPIFFGFVFSGLPFTNAMLPQLFSSLVYFGLVAVGLTLIPLLNFVILDTFVIDFSKAFGERIDFLSVLTNVI